MRDYVGLDASRQPRGLVKPVHCGRAFSPLGHGSRKPSPGGERLCPNLFGVSTLSGR